MKTIKVIFWIAFIFLAAGLLFLPGGSAGAVQGGDSGAYIYGRIEDSQFQPVRDVNVTLVRPDSDSELATSLTLKDGRFALALPLEFPSELEIQFARPHFGNRTITLDKTAVASLQEGQSITLPVILLDREITAAFWIAGIVFILVLILIASGFLHNTLAAFAGASVLLTVSYLGTPLSPNLHIFNFSQAVAYIDWNVVFLIMGMMMVIAVVENTGIFHWLAYHAYRISEDRMWVLLPAAEQEGL